MPFRPHFVNIAGASQARGTAVVIDVLRAYTTAAWAFAVGADRILLTDDTEQALAFKARIPGALALKDARPYDGFELTNSPVELQAHDLRGRTIVQRTTAGTVGAVAARHADPLYCAAFLNAAATARAIHDAAATHAYFVVTGENGAADEDQACAEYIAALVQNAGQSPDFTPLVPGTRPADATEVPPSLSGDLPASGLPPALTPPLDPAPYLKRLADSKAAQALARRVAEGIQGTHSGDVHAAMQANRFDFVMIARREPVENIGQALVLRPHKHAPHP